MYPSVVSQRSFEPRTRLPIAIWKYVPPELQLEILVNGCVARISLFEGSMRFTPALLMAMSSCSGNLGSAARVQKAALDRGGLPLRHMEQSSAGDALFANDDRCPGYCRIFSKAARSVESIWGVLCCFWPFGCSFTEVLF